MLYSIHSPHEAAIIESLQYQGDTNHCAAYTIATILNALSGSAIDGSKLALEMNKPAWRGIFLVIRRIPGWATFPWGIADVFHENGFEADWGFFYSINNLRQSLDYGNLFIPIICSWRPLWAHVLTLLAWDEIKGWGFANTQHNIRQIYWISNRLFIKQWNATARMAVEIRIP